MANDLSDAIIAALRGNATIAGFVTGGFSAGHVSPPPTPPYAIVMEIGESPSFSSLDSAGKYPYIDTGQIQLSLFVANSKTLAKSFGLQIETFLTDNALAFSTGYLMNLRRSFRITVEDPDPYVDGQYLWHHVLTFDTQVGRTI